MEEVVGRVLLLGDSGVGKTSILMRFAEDQFQESYTSTIGVDLKIKHIEIEGKNVKLRIYDTAGQERFQSITSKFYKEADAIILVYDITDRSTFDRLKFWIDQFEQQAEFNKVAKILVGNKCDLHHKRQVATHSAEEVASRLEICFLEVSALEDKNIQSTFQMIAKQLFDQNKEMQRNPSVRKQTQRISLLETPIKKQNDKKNCNC